MPSSNATIRAIEQEAKRRFPNKSQMDQRFAYRNQLRAAAGLPPERRQRGGVAGAYDRNKQYIAPILSITGAMIPAVGGVVQRLTSSTVGQTAMRLTATSDLAGSGLTRVRGGMVNSFAGGGAAGTLMSGVGAAIGGIITSGVNRITDGLLSRIGPPALPANSFGGQTPIPRPVEGAIGRTISRLLPGGLTGYEFTPVNDMTDKVGRPIAVYPRERTSMVGPTGYVVVDYNGEKIAMLRGMAIRAGLYKAPPKPPVSGYDMRAINRAHAATKRVKKLAGKVGFACAKRGTMRKVAVAFGKKK